MLLTDLLHGNTQLLIFWKVKLRVTQQRWTTHDVLTGSDDGRHSNTSLAWGAGVQFNPTESVTIDLAYEGSGSGDWRTDAFIVGIGYRF
ncbi:hypothetical protein P423_07395 [Escherichia coli JJ1886]|nr:Ail/Lom family outer membrane beta-barrel protein [Escherichia coli]AGY87296.1 hypothetical protein P423_07395 [Escherichia coli JJ1886]